MRNKSWLMIEDCKEIFGKDRADGAKILDVGDVARCYLYPKTIEKNLREKKNGRQAGRNHYTDDPIHEDTSERLKEISTRIGYDFDLSTKRAEVFDQMQGIPGLTLKQQFYISKKLVKEPEIMDLFRGLSEIAHPAFVFDLLKIDAML
ncbi:hypothetical protein SASPL_111298 [Salvia splendens]|uniref:Uncharacterized protein n=1 Tax=Salvia splendens TaxID=180675 RepID=A0A8X8Y989_SALSN|nr:hypothetical protein SASPL_111298 [Salvia splendens]